MGVPCPPSDVRFSIELPADDIVFNGRDAGGVGCTEDLRAGIGAFCDINGSYAKLSMLLDCNENKISFSKAPAVDQKGFKLP